MLSSTTLAVSRVSPRRTVTALICRANSTDAVPTEQNKPTTAAGKRSIPVATAFADLLARKGPSSNGPTSLSSLGDDQFDGLGRVKNRFTGQNSRQQKHDSLKAHRQKINLGEIPTRMVVDGVDVDLTPQRKLRDVFSSKNVVFRKNQATERAEQTPNNRRPNRNQNKEQGQGHRGRTEGRVSDQRVDRKAKGGQAGTSNPSQRRINRKDEELMTVLELAESESLQSKDPPLAQEVVSKPKPVSLAEAFGISASPPVSPGNFAPSKKSSPPRVRHQFQQATFMALFGSPSHSPSEVQRVSSPSALVATPTVLEEKAGDYSRYLDQDLATRHTTSPKLGPVDSAKMTLAKRPDVDLTERQKAVGIVTAATGLPTKPAVAA